MGTVLPSRAQGPGARDHNRCREAAGDRLQCSIEERPEEGDQERPLRNRCRDVDSLRAGDGCLCAGERCGHCKGPIAGFPLEIRVFSFDSSRGESGNSRAIKFLTTWNASGIDGTVSKRGPFHSQESVWLSHRGRTPGWRVPLLLALSRLVQNRPHA